MNLKVKCENCKFSRRVSYHRYEIRCLVYNKLKLPSYPRLCPNFQPR